MTTKQRKRSSIDAFAERYGIPYRDACSLRGECRQFFECAERECNGDFHPQAKNPRDKNECATLWNRDAERTATTLNTLAARLGFGVDYRHGLYPVLTRGDETAIHCPA